MTMSIAATHYLVCMQIEAHRWSHRTCTGTPGGPGARVVITALGDDPLRGLGEALLAMPGASSRRRPSLIHDRPAITTEDRR